MEYVVVKQLPQELLEYSDTVFENILSLAPKDYSKVVVHNKQITTKRRHMSYLNTPSIRDVDTDIDSYMFSGKEGSSYKHLPEILFPFLDYVNKNQEIPFNQVTVNWFFGRYEFIPFHKDCEVGMVVDSDIVIISLGSPRNLCIKNKEIIDTITCANGTVVILKNQKEYRHKLCTGITDVPRVSISFRKYKLKK